jgi:DNA-binding CsgD family transcriptional regulator
MRIYALAALGLLELGLGEAAAAAGFLVEADDIRRSCGARSPVAVPLGADLVEALTRAGHTQRAHRAVAEHRELAEESGLPWAEATMARCQALLATNLDEADAYFAAALALHPAGVPFEVARTRLCWGEELRRRRDITASREHLLHALSTFERLGARLWAERANSELRSAGGKVRATRGPALARLSSQELHCALAAASGRSNREVAAALFISSKTVEYHLGKVYTKLGITSRTQLARILDSERVTTPADGGARD